MASGRVPKRTSIFGSEFSFALKISGASSKFSLNLSNISGTFLSLKFNGNRQGQFYKEFGFFGIENLKV
jgi:hypothetical protein